MSKSVLISIQPEWCRQIANGKKTVEVRKSRPQLETPFKVYIYCTCGKGNSENSLLYRSKVFGILTTRKNFIGLLSITGYTILSIKIIGEFVVDYIDEIIPNGLYSEKTKESEPYCLHTLQTLVGSCLTKEEIQKYLGDNRGYGWHISDLIIYDTPKELSEFGKTKPPQSWCYVD